MSPQEQIPSTQHKALNQQRFGQFAQAYVASADHASQADLDLLVDLAQPQPGWVALDVATGGGHTALQFARHVARVVASDLTPNMLAAARRFIASQGIANVLFSLADAERLSFQAGSFDLVTCRIAPHHFTDVPAFVREAARSLKPGGMLVVQDHLLPEDPAVAEYVETFERLRDPSHQRACSKEEWMRLFTEAGLEAIHTAQIEKRHKFLPWVERQGCPPPVVARLEAMLRTTPAVAAGWMEPHAVGTPEASFANQHILIAGRKKTSSPPGSSS